MPFDPNTAKQVVTGFDPNSAKPIDEPVQTQDDSIAPVIAHGVDEVSTFRPVEKAKAALSGAANAGVDFLNGVADFPAYIASKIPGLNKLVTPEAAQRQFDDNQQGLDLLRPENYFPSLKDAKQNNPLSYATGYLPAALATGTRSFGLLNDALKIPQATKGIAAFLTKQPSQIAAAGITSSLTGHDMASKDTAAELGMASAPALNVTGAALSQLGKGGEAKVLLKQELQKASAPLLQGNFTSYDDAAGASIANLGTKAKEIENANYAAIKGIAGTINQKPVTRTIFDIGKKTQGTSDEQKAILQDLFESAKNMQTMDDALKLKQSLSKFYTLFSGKNATDTVFNKYKTLQNQVDSAIGMKAESAGLGKAWDLANRYHKEVIKPLQDFGIDDVMQAVAQKDQNPTQYAAAVDGLINKGLKTPNKLKSLLTSMDQGSSSLVEGAIVKKLFDGLNNNSETFSFPTTYKKLNDYIHQFQGTLSTDSINTLKGVRAIISDRNLHRPAAKEMFASMMVGGSLGGALGASLGPGGAAVGSLAGMAAGPKVSQAITHLLDNPTGVFILRGIGAKAPWQNSAKKAILDGLKVLPNTAINTSQSTNGDDTNGS